MDKEALRPYYMELQGFLSQIPLPKTTGEFLDDSKLWNKFNGLVDSIIKITNKSEYERFKIKATDSSSGFSYVDIIFFRTQLSSLISFLHGEYYSTERPPFSGPDPSSFNMNVTQSQTVSVQVMLFEFRDRIDEILPKVTDDKEKGFLNKLKSAIAPAKDYAQFLNIVLSLANQFGISTEALSKMFSM
jgi:hypothetical protein